MTASESQADRPWTAIVELLEERGLLIEVSDIVRGHRVTMFEACGRGRSAHVVHARHAVWRHLRGLGFSYPEIARIWGVNHASVQYALKKNGKEAV